jgi:type II pantothenate kinase
VGFISQHNLHHSLRSLPCTGGGAHKYASLFQELAGIHLQPYDEIECTILGLNLLLTKVPDEVYTFEDVDFKSLVASRIKTIKYDLNEDIFPYLVSIIPYLISKIELNCS